MFDVLELDAIDKDFIITTIDPYISPMIESLKKFDDYHIYNGDMIRAFVQNDKTLLDMLSIRKDEKDLYKALIISLSYFIPSELLMLTIKDMLNNKGKHELIEPLLDYIKEPIVTIGTNKRFVYRISFRLFDVNMAVDNLTEEVIMRNKRDGSSIIPSAIIKTSYELPFLSINKMVFANNQIALLPITSLTHLKNTRTNHNCLEFDKIRFDHIFYELYKRSIVLNRVFTDYYITLLLLSNKAISKSNIIINK